MKPIEVTAAIIIKSGRVLIGRRRPGKHLAGYWEFPGGKMESGETPESCLKREIFEEMGLEIEVKTAFHENLFEYSSDKIVIHS